ncbi:MAG: phosphoadenylyl-sulfate reductase [Bacteroidetes bacterium]|nr:phosphoadenylyl-sulfate reductase [Bacteroidota bacterium]
MSKDLTNKLNDLLTDLSAEEILKYTFKEFNSKIAFASSLGLEDQIITHMIAQNCPEMAVFTLDTGRLFPETYDLIDKTNARYKMKMKIFFPEATAVEEMVNTEGINLFFNSIENRKRCCGIRKTEPLKRALQGLDAWVTGLRNSQSVTRLNMQIAEWDDVNQLIKINPLIRWSEEDVKNYIKQNSIPYNILHDNGFPSIGCQPCTRAVSSGEDLRAGRWWWELPEQKECGLHKAK